MTKVQTQNLWRKIHATKRVSQIAKKDSGEHLGSAFVEAVVELTPKDTNRLANGWIDAGRKAGVSNRMPLPLEESSRRDQYLKQMQEEMVGFAKTISRLRGWMEFYEREDAQNPVTKSGKPRKKRTSQPYYRKLQRRVAKAEWRLDRVIEEYEKALGSEHFIFFDREAFIQRKSNRSFSTVRMEPIGGDGRVYTDGDRLIIELINREPHGTIVERHPHLGHPVATAKELVRRAGLRPVARAYLTELRAKSPMGTGTGQLGPDPHSGPNFNIAG